MNNIAVQFSNSNSYTIALDSGTVAKKIAGMVKHLSSLPLRFENYDNPFNHNWQTAHQQLMSHAQQLNLTVDADQLRNQNYLNHLHELYERNYDGAPAWLQYHEAIHMIENVIHARQWRLGVNLTYGEKSGHLDRPYHPEELLNITPQVTAGQCYLEFNELGKTPLQYFINQEPNDVKRFCELAKPFVRLNFKLTVALHDIDFMPDPAVIEQYQQWVKPHWHEWCQHWNVPDWTIEQTVGVLPIGHVHDIDQFAHDIKAGAKPIGLSVL